MTDEQVFELAERNSFQDDSGCWIFKNEGLLDFVFMVQKAEREACAVLCENMGRNGDWITKTDLRKAAGQALEALESVYGKGQRCEAAIKELRQALAEPANSTTAFVEPKASSQTEQEPLGGEWVPCVKLPVIVHVRNQRDGETHISTREGITPVLPEDLIMRGVAGEEYPIGRELFERTYTFDTAPPKREWVGLTRRELDIATLGLEDLGDCYTAIEAKLKEKNT